MNDGLSIDHVDETGARCTRHGPVDTDAVLAFAAVGSRIGGFHHDAASKLQGLMMALDEIELARVGPPEAVTNAQTAVQALTEIFAVNRALAKSPQRQQTALREVLARAADRHGVRLRGAIPTIDVLVAPPSIVHACALVLDIAAGAAHRERVVDLEIEHAGERVTIAMRGEKLTTHPRENELVAIAAFLLRREEGELRCAPKGFVVALPLAS